MIIQRIEDPGIRHVDCRFGVLVPNRISFRRAAERVVRGSPPAGIDVSRSKVPRPAVEQIGKGTPGAPLRQNVHLWPPRVNSPDCLGKLRLVGDLLPQMEI